MPDIHVFGHTHIPMDATVDGIRYVQWPLGTPREQTGQTLVSSFGYLPLYDASRGGEAPQQWTHWGEHYRWYERDLNHVERAPWAKRLLAMLQRQSKPAPPTPQKSVLGALFGQ